MTAPATTGRTIDAEEPTRYAWLARLFGRCLAAYVWLVGRTARVLGSADQPGPGHLRHLARVEPGGRHRGLEGCCATGAPCRSARAASAGIVMNTMLRSFGARGRDAAARRDAAREPRRRPWRARWRRSGAPGHVLVVSCDGPFGPYRVAKPGVLIVARESGLPIQPWAIASRPPFRLNGRWDRMIVALPFGRMRVFEGSRARGRGAGPDQAAAGGAAGPPRRGPGAGRPGCRDIARRRPLRAAGVCHAVPT